MPKNSNKLASINLFKVDPVTGEIMEEKRVPHLMPGHVFVTEEVRNEYVKACARCRDEGITTRLKWGGGDAMGNNKTFIVPPDTRPRFSLDIQKSGEVVRGKTRKRMKADGAESVPIVITKLNDRDQADKSFNETVFLDVGNDREIEFTFVKGVAAKAYKSPTFGVLDIRSRNDYKIINPDFIVLAE